MKKYSVEIEQKMRAFFANVPPTLLKWVGQTLLDKTPFPSQNTQLQKKQTVPF